ncbi:MAG: hypothetical protein WB586_06070 [Chthoniobacterales bacterium]
MALAFDEVAAFSASRVEVPIDLATNPRHVDNPASLITLTLELLAGSESLLTSIAKAEDTETPS